MFTLGIPTPLRATIRLGPEHYDPEPARQKIAAAEARRARRNAKRAREAAKVGG